MLSTRAPAKPGAEIQERRDRRLLRANNAGHTRGPWAYTVHGDGYHIESRANGLYTFVATVHGMRPHDARLIAVAPELLAAVGELLADRDARGLCDCPAVTRARRAAAKATGEGV